MFLCILGTSVLKIKCNISNLKVTYYLNKVVLPKICILQAIIRVFGVENHQQWPILKIFTFYLSLRSEYHVL